MIIGNRYEVIKEIGKGGMANVYLAQDKVLDRQVAIKVLKGDNGDDPLALERFKREANAATKLSHPNAVDVYDVGDEGDYHYIVMEYVKGRTLKQLIKRRGALPPKEAVWVIKQLSYALLEAHKNGIIHRDIKSQNVLIKDDGTVKLADFGIAVINNAVQITSKGSILGSVHYLAPELAKGGNASMQSDIYSLGIVFYELLTGDVPYKADTPVQIALKHIKNDVPFVRDFNPDIPQAVENIIIKATARDLNQRYANIALFIKDLNRCLKDEAKNDERLILKENDNIKFDNIQIANNVSNAMKKKKEEKTTDFFNIFFIIIMSMISIVAIIIILFIAGRIGNNTSTVEVPDLTNKTLNEARDILSTYGLLIDDSQTTWELTDDIPNNVIISYTPEKGSSIEKGSKIKVVVSEGTYGIMENYVGKNIEEVSKTLKELNFNVEKIGVESDKEVGTIISQSGIEAGDKYNPNIVNKVSFTYSQEYSMLIPYGTLGRNVDEVYNELTEKGFKVNKETINVDDLNDNEKAYGQGNVVRMNPVEGTFYIQKDDSTITLYYY